MQSFSEQLSACGGASSQAAACQQCHIRCIFDAAWWQPLHFCEAAWLHCRRWAMISHPAAAEAGLQCVSMVVLGWIGCSLSGGCATLWMIRMFTWGRRAATACAGNHSTSARYPVARERERGVRAFKAVVVFHASRRRVLAQRGIPTAHYSHLSLSESWFFVLSDRSTRARSRSRYGRTDGLGVTRAAKQLIGAG